MICVSIACILTLCIGALAPTQQVHPLQGTELLTWQGDLSERMMDGAHRFVEREIDESSGIVSGIGIATSRLVRRTSIR